jgi:hypothetical protein
MSRATGTFQQTELREKIRRLEEEIARTRATAQEVSRRAQERLAGTGVSGPAAPIDDAASEKKPKA